ncbi:MAG: dodecin domain-containing protein [Pirellulales bacterium]|nr:dodecin domain-containing protein [Pirellulales bacterium]
MSDPIFKKIEVVGTSTKSFSEAAANAVTKAAETVRNISWFEVVEQRGNVMEGMIQQYQVTVQIGFRLE